MATSITPVNGCGPDGFPESTKLPLRFILGQAIKERSELAASGLPSGTTATFSPNPATGGAASSTLTVEVGSSVAAGTLYRPDHRHQWRNDADDGSNAGRSQFHTDNKPDDANHQPRHQHHLCDYRNGSNGFTGNVAKTVSGLGCPVGRWRLCSACGQSPSAGLMTGPLRLRPLESVAAGTYSITGTGVSSGDSVASDAGR